MGENMNIIGNEWDKILSAEFEKPYFVELAKKVADERQRYEVYPPEDLVFSALKLVDFEAVKVVILGQDPYHERGQANGMAFAVGEGTPYPPSLVNIFKELAADLGQKPDDSGTLIGWAKQGVLLLNTVLTVRKGQAFSHAAMGWQYFTDAVIAALNRHSPLVYILWGSKAIAKSDLIADKHFIVSSPHPSPLSAYNGFFGSKPFSKTNAFLVRLGLTPIDWSNTGGAEVASYYQTCANIHKV